MAIFFTLIENINFTGSISPFLHKLRLSTSTPLIHVHTHTIPHIHTHTYIHMHTQSVALLLRLQWLDHHSTYPRCHLCSVQFSSITQSCLTVWDPMDYSKPGFPVHHQLMSIESVMPPSHLILCRSLLVLPSIFPRIRVFSNESVLCIRWPKYWSFSVSISPSNEYSGLISFRTDWLDLLVVQGPLKSFPNPTVQKHQLFCAQLSL